MLDAAERIFERDGWRETTLAGVGAEAGVSRGTPAYFFGSKAGLLSAMSARLVAAAREAATAQGSGDPEDRLVWLLSGQLGFVAARPGFARLAVEHWSRRSGLADSSSPDDFEVFERDLIRRIVELIEAVPGRAPDPEPGAAAVALVVMAWSAGLPRMAGGSASSDPANLADRSAFLASMVRKIVADNRMGETGDVGAGSLQTSKYGRWRLPGVG